MIAKRIAIMGVCVLLVPAIALAAISRRTYVVRYDESQRAAYRAGMADGFEAAAHLLRAGVGPRETAVALEHYAAGVELDGRIEPQMVGAAIGQLMAYVRTRCYQERKCR